MASLSVQDVVELTKGRVVNSAILGEQLSRIQVENPSPLSQARPSHIAFFFSRAFEQELPTSNPGILVTAEPFVKPLEKAGLPFWKTAAVISCEDPYLSMALLSERFADGSSVAHLPGKATDGKRKTEIHPTAVVSPSAELGSGVKIGPHCVVEENVRIGSGTVLYPGVFVGPGCVLGEECTLFPKVTLYEWTQLGNRVRIHAGSVIGADGFGYAPRRTGKQVLGHQKIYHLGKVLIGDDVEIGANACIDRGTFGDTRIGDNAKIDNLVQVGHNVSLDEGAVICGGTALAGNSSVGKYAYVAGVSGICNHVHIGAGATVAAQTLVSKDVPPGGTAVGNPQREYKEHFRAHALLSRLVADRRKK